MKMITKTMCRCNAIVTVSLKKISSSMKTYSCRGGLSRRSSALFKSHLLTLIRIEL